jgi:hypothetical protein
MALVGGADPGPVIGRVAAQSRPRTDQYGPAID